MKNHNEQAISRLIQTDPYLETHRSQILQRKERYDHARADIDAAGGLAGDFTLGHRYFGFNRGEKGGVPGIWYREWAPGATRLSLIGEFNDWDRRTHPLHRDAFGVWHIFLPDAIYDKTLRHGSLVKVHVVSKIGAQDRIPAYIRRVVPHGDLSHLVGQVWWPEPYAFQYAIPPQTGGLRIYQAHIGMALEEERIGTFDEFRTQVLPRIPALGYNALQLMAIMEHPYYASFGYHVSNFFAVSSRFGTPEQLKQLIDEAHGAGLKVILDLVHSHTVKNMLEGLNHFDGTDHQYFHAPPRGVHPAWDSLLFDYGLYEVKRFLLSNIRYWLEEFRFDGFRFDGVTSMLYLDHGLNRVFTSYQDYFGSDVDADAVTYLQLATETAHTIRPDAICIAEDVSGMPGLAWPVDEGGLGFDYRLAMGVPDYWIKLVKEVPDEQWDLGNIFYTMMNRRRAEKHIGYVESHDQALVGDQTLAFRLMGAAMYDHMAKDVRHLIIDRGIALLKMIYLITFALAGEGYLGFMGNEFGHPEWIDFPREGNDDSFQYARRQWSLADNPNLRYGDILRFNRAMLALDNSYSLLLDPFIEQLALQESERCLVFRRGPLVFALNFHPTASYFGHRIPVPDRTDYRLIVDTDAPQFSGFGRNQPGLNYVWQDVPNFGRMQSVQVYLPNRTALVLAPVSVADRYKIKE